MTGSIKWFSESKGYGFIKADNGQDVFCHFSAFPGGHTRDLGDITGRKVAFDIGWLDGREFAINIEFI